MEQPQFLSQSGVQTTLVLPSLVSHDHETPQPTERCLPSHPVSQQVQQQPPRLIRSHAFWGERNDPTASVDTQGSTVRSAPGTPRWRRSLILWRCWPPHGDHPPRADLMHTAGWLDGEHAATSRSQSPLAPKNNQSPKHPVLNPLNACPRHPLFLALTVKPLGCPRDGGGGWESPEVQRAPGSVLLLLLLPALQPPAPLLPVRTSIPLGI